MSARADLHPLTLASIKLNARIACLAVPTGYRCGCDDRNGWYLCQYHQGYEDACQEASEAANRIDAFRDRIDPMSDTQKPTDT